MIKKNLGLEKDDEKGGDGVKRKNNNGMKWLLIKVNARTLSEWNGITEKGGKGIETSFGASRMFGGQQNQALVLIIL